VATNLSNMWNTSAVADSRVNLSLRGSPREKILVMVSSSAPTVLASDRPSEPIRLVAMLWDGGFRSVPTSITMLCFDSLPVDLPVVTNVCPRVARYSGYSYHR
jgi:hypothetical protein